MDNSSKCGANEMKLKKEEAEELGFTAAANDYCHEAIIYQRAAYQSN